MGESKAEVDIGSDVIEDNRRKQSPLSIVLVKSGEWAANCNYKVIEPFLK
jgi:hypothetical protein